MTGKRPSNAKGARSPAPPPPPSAAQRQRDLARVLVRMDEMLKGTSELAARARARVSVGGLNRFRRFAKRVRDFFAMAAVAEEKLYNMPELADSPMATALDRMHARMVVLFIEGSWGFFDAYRRVTELPLGANEICGVELRGLLEIRRFLDDERYDGERGQALRLQAERVTDLMRDIMDRVPPLEDFGDLPSISPKGVSRQPIKTTPKPPPQAAPPPPPEPEPEPEAQWAEAPPWRETASWRSMNVSDEAGDGPPPRYEAAGGAWPSAPEYAAEQFDDSAYLDDAPDEPDVEAAASDASAQRPSERAEPSPLVRELTLDMVEAEERRAALAERLAASRPASSSPQSMTPPSTPTAPTAQKSTALTVSPPPAAPSSQRPVAAPFRAPPSVRPIKRS